MPDTEVTIVRSTQNGKFASNKDNEKELKLMENVQSVSGYSKLTLGSEREDLADEEDKPINFSEPIPGLSSSTSRKGSTEIKSDTIVNVQKSELTSLAHKKHGKMCWWWRKGRCHHGDECWFEHNLGVTGAARRSHRGPTITRKSWKQIHPPNSN